LPFRCRQFGFQWSEDASQFGVRGRCRGQRAEIGISRSPPKLTVNAGQQVAIEGSGYTERVVVGGNELGQWLLKIRAEQQHVARLNRLANPSQELSAGSRSKLPIELPRNSTRTASPGLPASHGLAQGRQGTQSQTQNADLRQIIEFALATHQS